jgi:hypothetical protein
MSHVTIRVLLIDNDAVDRLACRRALQDHSDCRFALNFDPAFAVVVDPR